MVYFISKIFLLLYQAATVPSARGSVAPTKTPLLFLQIICPLPNPPESKAPCMICPFRSNDSAIYFGKDYSTFTFLFSIHCQRGASKTA
jgi:hypothetical protein